MSGRTALFTVELPSGCKDLCEIAEKAAGEAKQAVAEVITNATLVEVPPEPDLDRFLAGAPDGYRWLIEGCLEATDRLILTGREGLGKSTLCQQWAIQIASGIHPFSPKPIEPVRVAILDCENGTHELIRRLRPLRDIAGDRYRDERLFVYSKAEGLDLGAGGEDQEWLKERLARTRPQVLFAGPIYKLSDGDPNSEADMKPLTTLFDKLRIEFDMAVVLEAHISHDGGSRPFGWSGWRRWPEIGLCLGENDRLSHWRPARHETPGIPAALERGGVWPFSPATRGRDVLWAMIENHARGSLTLPTMRELSTTFSVGVASIHRAVEEHREDWDQLAGEK